MWFALASVSALLSAAAAVTQKKVLLQMDALRFSFLLAQANLLVTAPLFLFIEPGAVTAASLAILFGKTVLGSLAFLCVMEALRRMDVSLALPVMVLTPGVVAVAAWLLLGEALGARETAGLLLLTCGVYLLEMRSGTPALRPFAVFFRSRGHRYLLCALLLFSATTILDKLLLRDFVVPPHALIAWQHLFQAGLFTLLMLLRRRNPLHAFRGVAAGGRGSILFVAVCTLGYRLSQVSAMSMAPVALVLAVKRTSVFVAAVYGGTLFSEERLMQRGAATLILIAGATLILAP